MVLEKDAVEVMYSKMMEVAFAVNMICKSTKIL